MLITAPLFISFIVFVVTVLVVLYLTRRKVPNENKYSVKVTRVRGIEKKSDTWLDLKQDRKMLEEIPVKQVDQYEQSAAVLRENLSNYDPALDLASYQYPGIDLLDGSDNTINDYSLVLEQKKEQMISILRSYKVEIDSVSVTIGPTVILYKIVPALGVRVTKFKNLEDDFSLSLGCRTKPVIGHIPGTNAVGIQIPREDSEMVSILSIIASEKFQQTTMDLPVALGKTMSNEVFLIDLSKLPHLLIGGATGQGKSVTLNTILASLLYKKHPSQLKFILIDVHGLEFTIYNKIERHFLAKIASAPEAVINSVDQVFNTLNSLCREMDERYLLLNSAKVQNLKAYNEKFIARELNPYDSHHFLPYIVVVIDEFSELIAKSDTSIMVLIARIAQLGCACGIHLVVSTQRATVGIVTGMIKANFAARIAFWVGSGLDSNVLLDTNGAELLSHPGDMLYSNGADLIHLQATFVSTEEVKRISMFIGGQRGYPEAYSLPDLAINHKLHPIYFDELDELFEDAARLVVLHQQGATSFIQRKLKLGYNRAGRIIDQLESTGVLGPFTGAKAREVLIPDDFELAQFFEAMKKG